MKKSIIALLLLIIIVGAWFVSGFWVSGPDDSGDLQINNRPADLQESGNGSHPGNTPDPGDDINYNPDDHGENTDPGEDTDHDDANSEETDPGENAYISPEQIEAERITRRNIILEESRLLFRGYFYEEAIALLNRDEEYINHETQSLEAEIINARNELVLFNGKIKHIFFHSLILYPEHLFPNLNIPTGGYNEGFIFQSEFNRLLPQLFERGYVLYDINDIFSKDADGIMRQNDIYLPPGKKPLVLSIDDPTYHYGQRFVGGGAGVSGGFDRSRRPGAGFANRIIFDEHSELATEVITPAGETIITYDGDVHIVLDAFVKENPEFSHRGHKGIITATGYMGIFGYDLRDLQNNETRQYVTELCDKFKDNGWLFASHSYSHNRTGFWGPETVPGNISWDIRRWKEEIEPLTGKTNLFIAPYGHLLRGEALQIVIDNGFDIYCIVDFNQPVNVYNSHAVMGRIEIGGYSLVRWANTLNRDFFDVAYVKDSHRPPIISS